MNDLPRMRTAGWLGLAAIIAAVYLAVGLLYAQHLGPAEIRGLLDKQGQDYLRSFPEWDTAKEVDGAGFNRAAVSILAEGLPRSREGTCIWRTAVYSYFVAVCYAVGGVRLWPLLLAQALVAGATGWLLARAAGPRLLAGCLAGLLFLINVRFAMYVGYVGPLILTLFWTALAFWAAQRERATLFGTSLALGIFTSSTFFVPAAAAAAWWWWRRRGWSAPLLVGAAIALKMLLTWTNASGTAVEPNRVADRGEVFWISNNPAHEPSSWWSGWQWRPAPLPDQPLLSATLDWIRANPGQYAKLCWIRLRTEFSPYTGQMSRRNQLLSTGVWLLVFPAGLWGLWRWRREPLAQLVGSMLVAQVVFATLVTEEPYLRYRMPVDLGLTLIAGLVYAELWSRWRVGRSAVSAGARAAT